MTAIKLLLFPLTIAVALLGPRYELWCLDEYCSDIFENALSDPAISLTPESMIAPNDCTCLPYGADAPQEDDDCDDCDD
jgi:hypothetical protein